MNIFIFGDSYFEPRNGSNDHVVWHDLLDQEYGKSTIFNYAIAGTGPHYNTPKIIDCIRKGDIGSGDVLICHISGVSRIEFPYRHDMTLNGIAWNFETKTSHHDWVEKHDIGKKYFDDFKTETDFVYLTFNDYLLVSGFALIGFLYSMSQCLNIKVLVFDRIKNPPINDEFFINLFTSKSNENFMYSKFNLFDVSSREIFFDQADEHVCTVKYDYRTNHLSEENHIKMFEYFKNFISNEVDPNFEFKENFRNAKDVFEIRHYDHPFKKDRYIYY